MMIANDTPLINQLTLAQQDRDNFREECGRKGLIIFELEAENRRLVDGAGRLLEAAQGANRDLHAQLAAAQAELHELRIRAGLAEAWQPTAAMWVSVPDWCNWCVANGDARLTFEEHEPQRVKDSAHRAGGWWSTSGRPHCTALELPIGIDWRLAKWQRPTEAPAHATT